MTRDESVRGRAELLRTVPLFVPLGRLALARLAGHLRSITLAPGQTLFRQGDPADGLYVVVAGDLEVFVPSNVGGETRIATLGRGDLVGEMALLNGGPRSATVRAGSESEVLHLESERFADLLRTEPGVARAIAVALARRVRAHDDAIMRLAVHGLWSDDHARERATDGAPDVREPDAVRTQRRRPRTAVVLAAATAALLAAYAALVPSVELRFLALLGAALALWLTDALPDFAVGLALIAAWILFGVAGPGRATAGFSSPEWIFVIAILGIAAAIARSGLLLRAGLVLVRRMPSGLAWQAGTLMLTGLLLTPLMPQNKGRAALVLPLALAIAGASRLGERTAASAILGMSAWIGAGPLMFMTVNGGALCLLTWGLLPEASRVRFDFMGWLLAAAPLGLFIAVLAFLSLFVLFRPARTTPATGGRVDLQLALLGPLSRREIAMIAVLGLTAAGWALAPAIGIDIVTVAVLGLVLAVVIGGFDGRALRELDWDYLIFYGVALSISSVAVSLGLDRAVAASLGDELRRLGAGPLVFVLGTAVVSLVAQLVLPKNQGVLFLSLALIPVAPAVGLDPWIAVITLLATSSMWFLPTQTTSYLVAYSASEGRLYSHAQARRVAFAYAAITLAGLAISLPYWDALGLISSR